MPFRLRAYGDNHNTTSDTPYSYAKSSSPGIRSFLGSVIVHRQCPSSLDAVSPKNSSQKSTRRISTTTTRSLPGITGFRRRSEDAEVASIEAGSNVAPFDAAGSLFCLRLARFGHIDMLTKRRQMAAGSKGKRFDDLHAQRNGGHQSDRDKGHRGRQQRTICTSYVERLNGTQRLFLKRLNRLTSCFSKKLRNPKVAFAVPPRKNVFF